MTPEEALKNLTLAATKSGSINWWDVNVHASMQESIQVIQRLINERGMQKNPEAPKPKCGPPS